MKEFDATEAFGRDDKTLSAEQRQIKAEQFIVAQMSPHPGHKVWEFDLQTGQLNEPRYERIDAKLEPVYMPGKISMRAQTHKKVIQRDNCLYCTALNKKNAIKKFVPMYARLVEMGYITREVVKQNPIEDEPTDVQP